MENLWNKSHYMLLNFKVGDYYESGGIRNEVIKRTKNRIYFSNGSCVTLKKCDNFFYLSGKNVNQILRDMEGYLVYLKHDPLFN